MTTIRVPRWMADQVRDRAKEEGYQEIWEVLLRQLTFKIPTPVPPRYLHLGPAVGTGPLMLLNLHFPVSLLWDELQSRGIRFIVAGGGLLPAEAESWRFRTPKDVERAREVNAAFQEQVLAARGRIQERLGLSVRQEVVPEEYDPPRQRPRALPEPICAPPSVPKRPRAKKRGGDDPTA